MPLSLLVLGRFALFNLGPRMPRSVVPSIGFLRAVLWNKLSGAVYIGTDVRQVLYASEYIPGMSTTKDIPLFHRTPTQSIEIGIRNFERIVPASKTLTATTVRKYAQRHQAELACTRRAPLASGHAGAQAGQSDVPWTRSHRYVTFSGAHRWPPFRRGAAQFST
jgi:hypothetical protein